jgi:non-specific serine/threonine protein kinase
MAEAAHALGRPDRAARLHGAAEAVRRAIGQAQHPDDQAQFERHLAEVRAAAGDAFEQLWAEGMAMGIDEAITYALSTDQPPAQTPEGEPAEDRSRRLSRREREVATLVARGLTNRQIAAELSIAERTADTHVSNILGKLGLASRAQLATWMTEQGHTE